MLDINAMKKNHGNTTCVICKQNIGESVNDTDDICDECFLKCADIMRVLEYLRNTSVSNLNIISKFISENAFTVKKQANSNNCNKSKPVADETKSEADKPDAVVIRLSTSEMIEINKDCFVFGCSEEKANYSIPQLKTISRAHAKIEYICGQYFLVDMNSKNGTKHNDVKILPGQKVQLTNGDEFSLSTEKFRFSLK